MKIVILTVRMQYDQITIIVCSNRVSVKEIELESIKEIKSSISLCDLFLVIMDIVVCIITVFLVLFCFLIF